MRVRRKSTISDDIDVDFAGWNSRSRSVSRSSISTEVFPRPELFLTPNEERGSRHETGGSIVIAGRADLFLI